MTGTHCHPERNEGSFVEDSSSGSALLRMTGTLFVILSEAKDLLQRTFVGQRPPQNDRNLFVILS